MSATERRSLPTPPDLPKPAAKAPAPVIPVVPADSPLRKRRLKSQNFSAFGFKYNRWQATLDETQVLDDTLDPTFWSEQAAKIMGHDQANPGGRGDIIEIRKPDTGLYAEVLIVEIGPGFVKVIPVRVAAPETAEVPEKSPLTTKWNAGKRTHDVVRKSDGQVMRAGFQTKPAATAWIVEHLKAMAA